MSKNGGSESILLGLGRDPDGVRLSPGGAGIANYAPSAGGIVNLWLTDLPR